MNGPLAIAAGSIVGAGRDDLAAEARELGDRKIVRMLDGLSMPPFVAALRAFASVADQIDPTEVALYTISTHEVFVPALPSSEFDDTSHHGVFERYFRDTQPTMALRGLANNTLCQIAVAGQFRGPNLHVVGRSDALELVVDLGRAAVWGDGATAALLVGFEATAPTVKAPPDADPDHLPPDYVVAEAAAIVLLASDEDSASDLSIADPSSRAVATIAGWAEGARVEALA